MDTIKNYLETMFANLPSTPEVWKAKSELYQMMEDKYTELREDGVSDNEAVARVISEFGNLDEIADDLGINKEVTKNKTKEVRMLSMDQVKSYLDISAKRALFVALGILCCIISIMFPIVGDAIGIAPLGVAGMFTTIGAGVGLFIYAASMMTDWKFIIREKCGVNYETANYIKEKELQIRQATTVHRIVGIIFCGLCWVPAMLVSESKMFTGVVTLRKDISGNVGAALLFVMVAVGVFYIVYSSLLNKRFNRFIKPNDANTISGTYTEKRGKAEYSNPTVKVIMKVFWPTITCVYLIASFTSFRWDLTWIIWPIAAITNAIIDAVFKKEIVTE